MKKQNKNEHLPIFTTFLVSLSIHSFILFILLSEAERKRIVIEVENSYCYPLNDQKRYESYWKWYINFRFSTLSHFLTILQWILFELILSPSLSSCFCPNKTIWSSVLPLILFSFLASSFPRRRISISIVTFYFSTSAMSVITFFHQKMLRKLRCLFTSKHQE